MVAVSRVSVALLQTDPSPSVEAVACVECSPIPQSPFLKAQRERGQPSQCLSHREQTGLTVSTMPPAGHGYKSVPFTRLSYLQGSYLFWLPFLKLWTMFSITQANTWEGWNFFLNLFNSSSVLNYFIFICGYKYMISDIPPLLLLFLTVGTRTSAYMGCWYQRQRISLLYHCTCPITTI